MPYNAHDNPSRPDLPEIPETDDSEATLDFDDNVDTSISPRSDEFHLDNPRSKRTWSGMNGATQSHGQVGTQNADQDNAPPSSTTSRHLQTQSRGVNEASSRLSSSTLDGQHRTSPSEAHGVKSSDRVRNGRIQKKAHKSQNRHGAKTRDPTIKQPRATRIKKATGAAEFKDEPRYSVKGKSSIPPRSIEMNDFNPLAVGSSTIRTQPLSNGSFLNNDHGQLYQPTVFSHLGMNNMSPVENQMGNHINDGTMNMPMVAPHVYTPVTRFSTDRFSAHYISPNTNAINATNFFDTTNEVDTMNGTEVRNAHLDTNESNNMNSSHIVDVPYASNGPSTTNGTLPANGVFHVNNTPPVNGVIYVENLLAVNNTLTVNITHPDNDTLPVNSGIPSNDVYVGNDLRHAAHGFPYINHDFSNTSERVTPDTSGLPPDHNDVSDIGDSFTTYWLSGNDGMYQMNGGFVGHHENDEHNEINVSNDSRVSDTNEHYTNGHYENGHYENGHYENGLYENGLYENDNNANDNNTNDNNTNDNNTNDNNTNDNYTDDHISLYGNDDRIETLYSLLNNTTGQQ